MNKHLHDTDIFFKSAYQQYEEDPSPAVWEKLQAALDKKDVGSKKGGFPGRKIAILVLVLFIANILFDYEILRTGINGTYKKPADKAAEKTDRSNASTINNIIITEQPGTNKTNKIAISEANPVINDNHNLGELFLSDTRIQSPVSFNNENPKGFATLQKSPFPVIQTNTPVSLKIKNRKKLWLVTAFISYDQSGYKLDSDIPNSITSIKHREVHEPSFSGGILITRPIKKNWSLQTGLIYTHTVIGINSQKLYALQDPGGDISFKYTTSWGYAYIQPPSALPFQSGDSVYAAEGKHIIKYLSIPLAINYTIGKKKMTLTPGAGIEANLLTSTSVETEIEDALDKETVFINKLNGSKSLYWSVAAQAELRYKISRKTALTLRPAFRYAISPVTENNDVETFPYSFGIGAGITVKF